MAMGSSDKSEFVAIVSALLYMQHAGIVVGNPQVAVDREARDVVALRAIDGAQALWEALELRGHVESEQP